MTVNGNAPQTRRRFLVAILAGAAATIFTGEPEGAQAATAEERRERRARRRAHRRERREERRERRRRRRHKT